MEHLYSPFHLVPNSPFFIPPRFTQYSSPGPLVPECCTTPFQEKVRFDTLIAEVPDTEKNTQRGESPNMNNCYKPKDTLPLKEQEVPATPSNSNNKQHHLAHCTSSKRARMRKERLEKYKNLHMAHVPDQPIDKQTNDDIFL